MTPRFEIPEKATEALARPPAEDEFRRAVTKIGVPNWYRRKCAALSAADWRGQITLAEAGAALDLWHAVWFSLEPPGA